MCYWQHPAQPMLKALLRTPAATAAKTWRLCRVPEFFSCTERCPVRRHAKDGEKYRDKPLTAICPVRVPTGVLGLLLPPLARSPLKSSRLRRWVSPTGHDRLDQIKRAAAADVAVVRENDRLVNPNAPGLQNDEL